MSLFWAQKQAMCLLIKRHHLLFYDGKSGRDCVYMNALKHRGAADMSQAYLIADTKNPRSREI